MFEVTKKVVGLLFLSILSCKKNEVHTYPRISYSCEGTSTRYTTGGIVESVDLNISRLFNFEVIDSNSVMNLLDVDGTFLKKIYIDSRRNFKSDEETKDVLANGKFYKDSMIIYFNVNRLNYSRFDTCFCIKN